MRCAHYGLREAIFSAVAVDEFPTNEVDAYGLEVLALDLVPDDTEVCDVVPAGL